VAIRTVIHSGSPQGAGSRGGNSIRLERAIFTKKPSRDFMPMSITACDVGLPISKNHCRSLRSRLWSK
jgi:hypothetical protein